ncbi:MAG: DUF4232 domain-containing protein [Acidobacteriaceae bacterium]
MSPRFLPLVCCSVLLASVAGCAGSHRQTANVAAHAVAPDDVALHGNPNAPYLLAGESPRLVARPTAEDAKNAMPCDPENLSVEEIAGDAHGSLRSIKLAFMNRGAVACTLGGYPAVSLMDRGGANIGSIVTDKITPEKVIAELSLSGHTPLGDTPEVTLMPDEVAAFQVVWTTGSECSSVSRIVVSAPGSTRAFDIAQPMSICAGRIQVTELRLDEGDT